MHEGYVKLWRKIWDNPRMRNPSFLAVWIWILTNAEYGMVKEDGKWRRARQEELRRVQFSGQVIRLAAGQLTAGAYQIEAETGVPRGTVERVIRSMKNGELGEELIEVLPTNRFSLITVKNWERYQQNEEQDEELAGEQVRSKARTIKEEQPFKKKKNTLVPSAVSTETDPEGLIVLYESVSGRRVRSRKKWPPVVKARLKDYTAEEIERAWRRMAEDDYLRGRDPRNSSGKDYFTLEYALRPHKIDEWLPPEETQPAQRYEIPAEAQEDVILHPDGTRTVTKLTS